MNNKELIDKLSDIEELIEFADIRRIGLIYSSKSVRDISIELSDKYARQAKSKVDAILYLRCRQKEIAKQLYEQL